MKEFREPINLGVKSSRHGKSTMMVKCPFCEEMLEVYIELRWLWKEMFLRSATRKIYLCEGGRK